MKINNYGKVVLVILTCSILYYSCGIFGTKSELTKKIEELGKDGVLDCNDLNELTKYVQKNYEDRSLKRFIKNGKVEQSSIKEYLGKNAGKSKLDLGNCDGIKVVPNFSIYLENSASMDGYVKGVSNFEAVLSNLVIGLNYHYDQKHVKFSFINSDIYPSDISNVDSFFKSLEPGVAPFKVGNQFVSELNQCFEKVLTKMKQNDVSIFVSDCIYSLEKGRSSQEGLIYQENLTKNAYMQRLKQSDFSTAIIKLNSSFNGVYYNYKNEKTSLQNVDRPYYVWIMGDDILVQDLLSKLKLEDLPGYQNSFFLEGKKDVNPNTQYLSTNSKGQAHYRANEPTSLKKIKFLDGIFQFSLAVDLNNFPDKKSLLDIDNYSISSGASVVAIQEIPKNNQPALIKQNDWNRIKDNGFTHLMTLKIDQKTFPEQLNIIYRSQIPKWVSSSSTRDDSDVHSTLQQTFGFNNLVHGVYEAYKIHNNNNDVLFEIKYNLTK